MFTIKFKALDAAGHTVRFTVREPTGDNAYRYAWDRAVKICEQKGWTGLKFA